MSTSPLAIIIPLVLFLGLDLYILVNTLKNKIQSQTRVVFVHFVIAVTLQQAMTVVDYLFGLKLVMVSPYVAVVVHTFSMILLMTSAYFWLHYMLLNIAKKKTYSLWTGIWIAAPVIAFVVLVIISNVKYWGKTFAPSAVPTVEPLFVWQVILLYTYVVMALVVAIREKKRGTVQSLSLTVKNLLVFVVPYVLGGVVQLWVYAGGYIQIGISIGLFFIYLQQYMDEVAENRHLKDVEAINEQLQARYNIIQSMTSIYFAAYYIDIEADTYIELKAKKSIKETIKESGKAQESLNVACDYLIMPDYQNDMRDFFNLSTMSERLNGKDAISCEYRGRTTGWSMAYMIAGDRDEEGKLKHVFYAARYNNDEKAREDEQKKQLEEYNDIISNAGMGIWHIILKPNQPECMQANRKMRELLGIGNEKLTGEEIYCAWHDRIVPDALESVNRSVQEMLAGNFSENTYLWNHPTLGARYVRCGGVAEKNVDGTFILSGYHYDVTDVVKVEQEQKEALAKARVQAEAANRAKTAFLFNMSHDIRTPMNAVIGFANLLEKNLDDQEKALDYVQKIKSSGDFLLSLINNVLEVARIESGKVALEETICESEKIFYDTVAVFDEKMKEKGIEFVHNANIEHKYLYADTVKIKEVLLNIVSNACKYTPAGGTVSISIQELPCKEPDYAVVQTVISDTGIGMAEDFLPRIFEEFSREKTVTEDKIEGTGLGMPIVKRLVELMSGSIEVESELGKGTTFTITIPHRIGNEPGSEEDNNYVLDEESFYGKHILLAEDNVLNAEIAVEILSEAGFKVDVAHDGIECIDMLQKAAENQYDVILMDVQMPNMDGYKATRIIRSMENSEKRSIPIIAMTANAFDEDRREAMEAGMNGHLAKPIKASELMNVLGRILG